MYVLKSKNNDIRLSRGDHNLLLDLSFSHGLRFCRAKGVNFDDCFLSHSDRFLCMTCHVDLIGLVYHIFCSIKFCRTFPVFAVSYTHLRAHETPEHLVCRLLLEKKKQNIRCPILNPLIKKQTTSYISFLLSSL